MSESTCHVFCSAEVLHSVCIERESGYVAMAMWQCKAAWQALSETVALAVISDGCGPRTQTQNRKHIKIYTAKGTRGRQGSLFSIRTPAIMMIMKMMKTMMLAVEAVSAASFASPTHRDSCCSQAQKPCFLPTVQPSSAVVQNSRSQVQQLESHDSCSSHMVQSREAMHVWDLECVQLMPDCRLNLGQ